MELEEIERGKRKTNLGDNRRGKRNWPEELGNQRIDKRKWEENEQHG